MFCEFVRILYWIGVYILCLSYIRLWVFVNPCCGGICSIVGRCSEVLGELCG